MPKIEYGQDRVAQLRAWRENQIANYIDTGGAKGHVEDMRFIGGHRFETMLLIRYLGRRSGRTMITSLGYCQFGPEIAIIASLGGADVHPQWYLNIKSGSALDFQIATQAFTCTWREVEEDAEREELKIWMEKANPIWGTYHQATSRRIPLLLLTPLEEIPVFRRSDISPWDDAEDSPDPENRRVRQ